MNILTFIGSTTRFSRVSIREVTPWPGIVLLLALISRLVRKTETYDRRNFQMFPGLPSRAADENEVLSWSVVVLLLL